MNIKKIKYINNWFHFFVKHIIYIDEELFSSIFNHIDHFISQLTRYS